MKEVIMSFSKENFYPLNEGQLVSTGFWNNFVNAVEELDKDKISKSGGSMSGPLSISAGNWDIVTSDGDFRIGDKKNSLKIAVVTKGKHAGDVRIRAQGGTGRLILSSENSETLVVQKEIVTIGTTDSPGTLKIQGRIKVNGTIEVKDLIIDGKRLVPFYRHWNVQANDHMIAGNKKISAYQYEGLIFHAFV